MNKKHVTILPLNLRLAHDFRVQCGAEGALRSWIEKGGRRFPNWIPRFTAYGFRGDLATAYLGQFRILLTDHPELRHLAKLVEVDQNNQWFYSIRTDSEIRTAEPLYLLVHDGWDGTCNLVSYDAARSFIAAHRITSGPMEGDTHEQILP